jgi:diaminopimelate dehydrogenase
LKSGEEMEKKIKVAVVGYGNVGRAAVEAIKAASDLELAGVVRSAQKEVPSELVGVPVVQSLTELDSVDVAVLSLPTRMVGEYAVECLKQGINTVDSFDIHGEELLNHRDKLAEAARSSGAVAVISAGWDPGTDSMVRALMELMAPKGLTFTNFGPGMSLGHSVAAKAIPGVRDALSMTIPTGSGVHRRMVYVELAEGAEQDEIAAQIKADPYFSRDETHVYPVGSVEALKDVGHGVIIERKGTSGQAANQLLKWEMRINNPALTAQVMVSAARASVKQQPGAYTLLEIPLLDYFPGHPSELIKRLV